MLENYVQQDLLLLETQAETREEIIDRLAELMEQRACMQDTESFLNRVYEKQKQGVSLVGDIAAVAYATSDTVPETRIAFAHLTNPIYWEGNANVSYVYLIAFSQDLRDEQKDLIHRALSQQLMDEAFIKALYEVEEVDDWMALTTQQKKQTSGV
ncbi:PTS sugar transporter subunit IIA [Hazenella sp. IB182357]|uniref:PTS sugar transporter subunit IIA n=1 Tax=Polycladospora coralii TaxID=2771432 RepID=A0A926RSA2_9BACL|nr:PTS sugar transporter subunit IIA [Polycladospora coralii]MBD1370815.1 PTS sugar transporter subunit IIA [Polycladospora coralii]MBS7529754.1 PTS sugar transporter subunit IIA [Polycladospora coralii]